MSSAVPGQTRGRAQSNTKRSRKGSNVDASRNDVYTDSDSDTDSIGGGGVLLEPDETGSHIPIITRHKKSSKFTKPQPASQNTKAQTIELEASATANTSSPKLTSEVSDMPIAKDTTVAKGTNIDELFTSTSFPTVRRKPRGVAQPTQPVSRARESTSWWSKEVKTSPKEMKTSSKEVLTGPKISEEVPKKVQTFAWSDVLKQGVAADSKGTPSELKHDGTNRPGFRSFTTAKVGAGLGALEITPSPKIGAVETSSAKQILQRSSEENIRSQVPPTAKTQTLWNRALATVDTTTSQTLANNPRNLLGSGSWRARPDRTATASPSPIGSFSITRASSFGVAPYTAAKASPFGVAPSTATRASPFGLAQPNAARASSYGVASSSVAPTTPATTSALVAAQPSTVAAASYAAALTSPAKAIVLPKHAPAAQRVAQEMHIYRRNHNISEVSRFTRMVKVEAEQTGIIRPRPQPNNQTSVDQSTAVYLKGLPADTTYEDLLADIHCGVIWHTHIDPAAPPKLLTAAAKVAFLTRVQAECFMDDMVRGVYRVKGKRITNCMWDRRCEPERTDIAETRCIQITGPASMMAWEWFEREFTSKMDLKITNYREVYEHPVTGEKLPAGLKTFQIDFAGIYAQSRAVGKVLEKDFHDIFTFTYVKDPCSDGSYRLRRPNLLT